MVVSRCEHSILRFLWHIIIIQIKLKYDTRIYDTIKLTNSFFLVEYVNIKTFYFKLKNILMLESPVIEKGYSIYIHHAMADRRPGRN